MKRLLGGVLGVLACAGTTAHAADGFRVNYDIRFDDAQGVQVSRGTARLSEAVAHAIALNGHVVTLHIALVDCATYRLHLDVSRPAGTAEHLDLGPVLAAAGDGALGAPLTLTARRAGAAVDGAFAVTLQPGQDSACR